jgi:hypothetical protein
MPGKPTDPANDESVKQRSESGPSNQEAMEQAQEEAAEEREDARGYQ